VSAVDAVQDIARVENAIYDESMEQRLHERNVKSTAELSEEDQKNLKNEVEQVMNSKIQKIGLNYLRGITLGTLVGIPFKRQAMNEVKKYIALSEEKKKLALAQEQIKAQEQSNPEAAQDQPIPSAPDEVK
jgi:hypothetical protein